MKLGREAIRRLVDVEVCPEAACGGPLNPWGFYQRDVRTVTETTKIVVPRCRCGKCGVTQQFLPPFVARYGRWLLDTLLETFKQVSVSDDSLSGAWSAQGADAMDLSTCYRWRDSVKEWFEKGDGRLQAYVARVGGDLDLEAYLDSRPDGSAKWQKARRWLLSLEAVNEARSCRRPPLPALSIGGVVYFLAHQPWQRLVM